MSNIKDDEIIDEGEKVERPAWIAQLPDDLKGNDELAKSEKIEDLSRSYLSSLEQNKELEGKISEIPQRPEEVNGYEFTHPVPPDKACSELEAAYKGWCFEADLSQDQADSIYKGYHTRAEELARLKNEEIARAAEDVDKQFHQQWGKDYDLNMELIRRTQVQFGGEEFSKYLVASKLGNHPQMVDFMLKVGQSMAEGPFIEGKPSPGGKEPTEEEKLKEQYPDMVKNGVPFRQELAPKEEPDEDLKARFPDMNLENL